MTYLFIALAIIALVAFVIDSPARNKRRIIRWIEKYEQKDGEK